MKRIGLLLLLVILASGSTLSQQKITWQKDGKEMALIPAGSFEMGDHFNEGSGSERPVHTVTLDAFFYMDVHE